VDQIFRSDRGLSCVLWVKLRIAWIITFFILPKETINKKVSPSLGTILKSYGKLLKKFNFCITMIGLALITSGVFVFYTAGYFVFNHTLHIPLNIIGYFTFLIVGGNFCGKFIGSYFALHLRTKTALIISASICLCSTLLMFILIYIQDLNLFSLLIPMMSYTIGLGSLMPVTRAYLMSLHPNAAGTASSLTGIMIALVASIVTYIIAHFHIETALPMTTLLVITSAAAWCFFLLSFRVGDEQLNSK
jgi:DHA1 family bicyclomycin/chloramphenicol resistance-like MFS transporter